MADFIEEILHLPVLITKADAADQIPAGLRNLYHFQWMKIAEVNCVLVKPLQPINLSVIRKHSRLIRDAVGMEPVFSFVSLRPYTQKKLLQYGISFVIQSGKQVYMPFIGVHLVNSPAVQKKTASKISFIAQKLLLLAVYQNWQMITMSSAAALLGITKMSISRVFDELEARDFPLIVQEGRLRVFSWDEGPQVLWNLIRPSLRSPLKKEFWVEKLPDGIFPLLSGLSALDHYAQLPHSGPPVYAFSPQQALDFQLARLPSVSKDDPAGTVIQIVGYMIPWQNGLAIDPLSAILDIPQAVFFNPQIQAAADQLEGQIFRKDFS